MPSEPRGFPIWQLQWKGRGLLAIFTPLSFYLVSCVGISFLRMSTLTQGGVSREISHLSAEAPALNFSWEENILRCPYKFPKLCHIVCVWKYCSALRQHRNRSVLGFQNLSLASSETYENCWRKVIGIWLCICHYNMCTRVCCVRVCFPPQNGKKTLRL